MIVLDGESLDLAAIVRIADGAEPVSLSAAAGQRVEAARRIVDRSAEGTEAVYGVNTGFGSLAEVRIPNESLAELQLNLLRSHAAGVGDLLPPRVVRGVMALRANVLAKGHSGVRRETLDALLNLLNAGVVPAVPSRGSVGASGDLAPLAHLALVLVGEGWVLDRGNMGQRVRGSDALRAAGLSAVTLQPKEGLALINGTQPSTAVLALALADALRLARAADIVAALTVDALRGSRRPFEPRIHDARPFDGQRASASNLWRLLEGSAINKSHEHCGQVQDAYSLRCAPQVHGAARDALAFVQRVVEVEANAATDNPMVFARDGDVVSGGNFHGAPIAIAADLTAIAVAQLASISERRSDRLLNPSLSGLPAFLTKQSGLHSGLMMAQVTAAALVSEIKTLGHPASVDSIPTSAGREDHVSMSMGAALKAAHAVALARDVVGIELLCACQAIDLLAPLATSPPLARVHARVREIVPTLGADRPPSPDIAAIGALLASGEVEHACAMDVK
ncbi:MAG TPA: histidine ammonia-lyase [Vicinamibacterales bacterium]|jgi:histidine ammonia-lyase|nr:histidine ammonia-lyase [Vicinamibacterales bacterium]